jgi:citrate lyase subunit beta/citryl-CoA lyase
VNRSWLYVPGDAADKLAGAADRGADAVIVDLEDSVPPAGKQAARATTMEWLSSPNGAAAAARSGVEVWVRINAADDWRLEDLAAIGDVPAAASEALTGILVPKASHDLLTDVQRRLALEHAPRLRVAGLVEDARALADVAALAATPGLSHLGMGEADLRAQLHLDPGPDDAELRPLRMAVVVASAAAGILPPVGATATDFRDLDALRASSERLRRLGFSGRTAIHPRQVPVINEVFTPGDDRVAWARDVVARLDAAEADGRGVAVDADGRMLDEAVARQARHVLALSAAAGRRSGTPAD